MSRCLDLRVDARICVERENVMSLETLGKVLLFAYKMNQFAF